MRHQRTFTLYLLMLAAVSVQAVTIPVPLPAIDIATTPTTPTSAQMFTVSLSGQWPDGCPPDDLNVRTVVQSDSLSPGRSRR